MRRFLGKKAIWVLCAAGGVCGLMAAHRVGGLTTQPSAERRATAPAVSTHDFAWARRVSLPSPMPRPGEPPPPPPRSTAQEQAAAMMSVTAGSLVRALSQAAAEGNDRAVEDLVKGLPRYGAAAREKIEEELVRTKSPKSREALTRALALLNS